MTAPSQCDLILGRLRRGDASTLALMEVSGSLAVHSRISELRDRGYVIEHRRWARTVGGRKRTVSVYRLVQQKKAAA